ncbi:MAG: lamin tail domain-containing protein [Planctomycetes bacterium]|nr:lamin tail domain-containing protein [Planctomycetota bacterium]
MISEFLACNKASLRDAQGDSSDWIEIHNPTAATIDLDGWYLTDDLKKPEKWQFPEVQLAAGGYLVVFASGKDRRQATGPLHTNFSLQASGESVALVGPDGRTIASAYRDYPPQLVDISYGLSANLVGYLRPPTPGTPNRLLPVQIGPAILNVTENPPPPAPGQDLAITAEVTPTLAPIRSVTLFCRINYLREMRGLPSGGVAMRDDGQGADATARDGLYTAVIPSQFYARGDMVRWYVQAQDTAGQTSRNPLFAYPDNAPEYYGTVIQNSGIVSALPILCWFTENPAAASTRSGTRGSVFFDSEFYDNIFIRQRGGATVGAGSKKFEFNNGYPFRFAGADSRVQEFNLNQNGSDPTYLRPPLAFETMRRAGCPASQSFLMLSVLNGQIERVEIFVEQVDDVFLERHGLDPHGALYKFVQRSSITPVFSDINSGIEKKTRRHEDFSDIRAVVQGLNAATAEQRRVFVFDAFNLPGMLDYLAARCLLQDTDDIRKNFYFYRDTEGRGEWSIFPWDKDWTFGVVGDGWIYTSHPFLGDRAHPKNNGLQWSIYLDVMYNLPQTREMFLRRTRTVMDELLQPPDTPAGRRLFENRIAELFTPARPHLGSSEGAVNALKAYFPTRRTQLYVDHNVNNKRNPPLGGNAGIPDAQPADATLAFGACDYDPVSGNQDEEFLELINPNSYAVDLSGWELAGGVEHTFLPGTVLVAGGSLYVSPDVRAFRRRAVSPTGGQGRFVQGNYRGHLSDWGETISLRDSSGRMVDTLTYVGSPSDQQRSLRISEIMYHPAPGGTLDNEQYEFIELQNIGPAPLALDGARLTEDVSYVFAPGGNLWLPPGACLVVARNRTACASRYSAPGLRLAPGVYTGSLDNAGATIRLEDRTGRIILEFAYDDRWFRTTDGGGHSLMIRDPAHTDVERWGACDAWQPSPQPGGSPGT